MAEPHTFPYSGNLDLVPISNFEMLYYIREEICHPIDEHRIFLDSNDIEDAVEILYPIVFSIVFNAHFLPIRRDEKKFTELVSFLATRLL